MESSDDRIDEAGAGEEHLAQLLWEYVDRLNSGEPVDPARIREDHPALAEELIAGIETLQSLHSPPGAAVPESPPLTTLGDYTLRRQIGRGGMGVVYEAWQNSVERAVALKVLPGGLAADDRAFQRFLREAKTAAKLDHPNVVSVHGMGVEEHTPYYSMEYVRGETLSQVLERLATALPGTDTEFGKKDDAPYFAALAVAFAAVADGLQHAHSRGVIHRDIKPSNLILDSAEDREPDLATPQNGDAPPRLRILDFGLARFEDQASLTLSGDIVGTPAYMSPEQAAHRRIPVDHRTDVYSLGATMYEAFCGRPPFRGESQAETLALIVERDPPEPRRANPRIPDDLETTVLKCLSKDAGDRYGTAEALAQDLRRFGRGDPIEARPAPAWLKLAWRVRRHKVRLVGALVLLTLLLVGGGLLWQWNLAELDSSRAAYDGVVRQAVLELHSGALTLTGQELGSMGFFRARRYMGSSEGGDPEVNLLLKTLAAVADAEPARPEARYYLSKLLNFLGRSDEAALHAARALVSNPDFAPAAVLEREIEDGEYRLASASIDELLSPYRESGTWQEDWLLAYKNFSEKNWSAAAAAYGELLAHREGGHDPFVGCAMEATMARGLAALRCGEYGLAIREFSGARRLWPGFTDATLLLAKAYWRRGQSGDNEEAESIFQELYSQASPEERSERAEWIALTYEQPGSPQDKKKWRKRITGWNRHRFRARRLVFGGRHAECIEECRAALATHPEDPSSLVYQGYARYSAQRERYGPHWDAERADLLEHARTTAELYPRSNMAQSALALALLASGHYEAAASVAAQVDEVDRQFGVQTGIGPWTLALVLRQQGRFDQALGALETAFHRDLKAATRKGGRNPVVVLALAQTLEAAGNNEEAREQYEELTALIPHAAGPHAGLAGISLQQGDYEEAIEHAKRAIERYPRNTPAYEHLAAALWKSGRLEQALAATDEGLEGVPGRPRLHFLRGQILGALGNVTDALESHVMGLELHPELAEAHEAFTLLLAEHHASLERTELTTLYSRLEASVHKGPLLRASVAALARTLEEDG